MMLVVLLYFLLKELIISLWIWILIIKFVKIICNFYNLMITYNKIIFYYKNKENLLELNQKINSWENLYTSNQFYTVVDFFIKDFKKINFKSFILFILFLIIHRIVILIQFIIFLYYFIYFFFKIILFRKKILSFDFNNFNCFKINPFYYLFITIPRASSFLLIYIIKKKLFWQKFDFNVFKINILCIFCWGFSRWSVNNIIIIIKFINNWKHNPWNKKLFTKLTLHKLLEIYFSNNLKTIKEILKNKN